MYGAKSVLIIDREIELYADLEPILQRYSYSYEFASSGLMALNRLKSERFDLVILELKLPDVEGKYLLSMLKRLVPGLPVLVLTSDNSMESTYSALHVGAIGYLLKPVDPQQVVICVNEIFRELQKQREKVNTLSKKPSRRTRLKHAARADLEDIY